MLSESKLSESHFTMMIMNLFMIVDPFLKSE